MVTADAAEDGIWAEATVYTFKSMKAKDGIEKWK